MPNSQNTVESINQWFTTAKPNATNQNLVQQLSYMIEELSELFEAINYNTAKGFMLALKEDTLNVARMGEEACTNMVSKWDREAVLDALCDITVTAIGVSTYASMDFPRALEHISQSNWSKFDENGKPILDDDGKITKGPNYFKPNLEPFV